MSNILRSSIWCGACCFAVGCLGDVPGVGHLGPLDSGNSGGPRIEAVGPGPIIGSILWNGFTENAATQTSFGVAASLYTTYASRKPANWGGDAATVGGGGWALASTNPGLHPVDTATIWDAHIADAKGAVDFFMYLTYPDTVTGQGSSFVSIINAPYYAHAASSHKGDVKRAIMLAAVNVCQPGVETDAAPWAHLADTANWLISEFADSDYMRIDGKPVLGFFRPLEWAGNGNGGNANTKANYDALIALLPTCYLIGYGEIAAASAAQLGMNTFTVYDTAAGAKLSPNGQHAWPDQYTKDQQNSLQSGFDFCTTISIRADDRPRLGEASWSWTDPPTPQQQIDSIINVGNSKILMLSPATEVDEAGPLVRTIQDGNRYYDVTRWARYLARWTGGAAPPGSYTYDIDARTLLCVQTGTWTRATAIAGAYDGDEISSSTANDTIVLTCDRLVLMRGSTGTIVIRGPTGSGLGTFDTLVNGVSQGQTSQAGSTAHYVSLKSVNVTLGQTVTFKAISGTVTIDTFQATVTP